MNRRRCSVADLGFLSGGFQWQGRARAGQTPRRHFYKTVSVRIKT